MVITEKPADCLTLAARNGFWDMCRTDVVRFTTIKGFDCPAGGSLFDTFFAAVKAVLKCSDEKALQCTALRLVTDHNEQHYSDYLVNLDAAIEVVDHQDRQAVVEQQKAAVHEQESMDVFAEEMASKRADIDGKRKRGPSTKPRIPHLLDQATARQWIPENTSIWQAHTRNEWWGHCMPFKRLREPFEIQGEEEACAKVIRGLWRQHNMLTGRPRHECPFEGIF